MKNEKLELQGDLRGFEFEDFDFHGDDPEIPLPSKYTEEFDEDMDLFKKYFQERFHNVSVYSYLCGLGLIRSELAMYKFQTVKENAKEFPEDVENGTYNGLKIKRLLEDPSYREAADDLTKFALKFVEKEMKRAYKHFCEPQVHII